MPTEDQPEKRGSSTSAPRSAAPDTSTSPKHSGTREDGRSLLLLTALCVVSVGAVLVGLAFRPTSARPPRADQVIREVTLRLGAPHVPGNIALTYSPSAPFGVKGAEVDLNVGLRVRGAHHHIAWAVDLFVEPNASLTLFPRIPPSGGVKREVIRTPGVRLARLRDHSFPGTIHYVISGSVAGPTRGFDLLAKGLRRLGASPSSAGAGVLLPTGKISLPRYVAVPIILEGRQPITRSGVFVAVSLPILDTLPVRTLGRLRYPADRFQAEAQADVGGAFSPYLGSQTQVFPGLWDWTSPGVLDDAVGSGINQAQDRAAQNHAFYSGLAFGVAANAMIALLVALLEPRGGKSTAMIRYVKRRGAVRPRRMRRRLGLMRRRPRGRPPTNHH
jgi:hypothetical protein